jgi:hypothetical protein
MIEEERMSEIIEAADILADPRGCGECQRCGRAYDDFGVGISCGLETPELKSLRVNAEAAQDSLELISLNAFEESEISRITGLTQHVRQNAASVLVYIDRKDWPAEASAARDDCRAAFKALKEYSLEPNVPTHLCWPSPAKGDQHE